MIDIFLGPKQYIQRENILKEAGTYLKSFGKRPLVLGDELVLSIVGPTLEDRLRGVGLIPLFVQFGKECTLPEISRLEEIVRRNNLDFIVGVGGGKAIDTSRLVAYRLDIPFITIPTSAATCSAASAASAIYANGVRHSTVNGKGADLVLVDSLIISQAPSQLLAAGMGDALAKWYEGKPCYDKLPSQDPATQAAMILSTNAKETIFSLGLQAKIDVEAKKNSPAVEAIVETNILITGVISGLGGSKFRVAVAHALLYGLTILPQIHNHLHGEIVSFGILVQLCLEKKEEELGRILPFLNQLGLPLTLTKLGLSHVEDSILREALIRTSATINSVYDSPFTVNENSLKEAMIEADERAKSLE